jgi:uncharacterized protein (DUF302 family)
VTLRDDLSCVACAAILEVDVETSLIVKSTSMDVSSVISALRSALDRRGIREFALIDHAAGAREAGLTLPEETVIIFGNPNVGTALMLADARSGLDLPLRVLVHDVGGRTEVVYRDVRRLAEEFHLEPAAETLSQLAQVLDDITTEATA